MHAIVFTCRLWRFFYFYVEFSIDVKFYGNKLFFVIKKKC